MTIHFFEKKLMKKFKMASDQKLTKPNDFLPEKKLDLTS